MIEEFLSDRPDTRLLKDESPNLRDDIKQTVGEDWLYAKNIWLENRTPQQLIGTDQEFRVRDLLRILMTADLS
jgi:hypothetical protein